MASLQDIRAKYPQYNDMSDGQLADALYAKHYADMPRDQFNAKIGLTPNNVTGADPSDQNPPVPFPKPQAPPSVGRRLGIGAQGVGAGMADVAGGPVDIVTGVVNLLSRGINAAGGLAGYKPDIPQIKEPFLGSEFIRNRASQGAEAVGVPVVDPATMNPSEKFGYDVNRFGTQALSVALPLAAAAPAREAAIASGMGAKPNLGDMFLRPYQGGNATRAVAGDAAAGVGAGAAVNTADKLERQPDSPWYNAGVDVVQGTAPIVGGLGGATLLAGGEGVARGLARTFAPPGMRRGSPDPNIPLDRTDPTGKPPTRAQAEKAARILQESASKPELAARNIRERSAEYRRAGGEDIPDAPVASAFGQSAPRMRNPSVGDAPVPTIGLISDDIGLQSAESAMRTKNAVPFVENDNRLRVAATEKVNSLRDPKVDQSLVNRKAKAAPKELAQVRDDAALPILREAEASGAKVDAQPIVDLIDTKLKTAKREPVVNALTNAKAKLSTPDGQQLDNTVAGLYESRKAIGDIIEGRTDNSTGRFAQTELIEVRNALDAQLDAATGGKFGQYLKTFREGSAPLNALDENQSVTKLINGEDPRDTAARLFGSQKYGAEKELAGVKAIVAKDPEAARAWKAAVSEHLADTVTGTTKIDARNAGSGETLRVELAKMDKLFADNRRMLAEVYSPQEMNTLQQAHKLLEPLKNASVRATGGSDTADKFLNLKRMGEAFLKLSQGQLKGGGTMRSLRLIAETLPTDTEAVGRLVQRAYFDPQIAEYLLTAKIGKMDGAASNAHVRRLMGAAAYGRSSGEEEK